MQIKFVKKRNGEKAQFQKEKSRDTKNLFDDAINKMDEYLSKSNWKVNENSNMGYSLQDLLLKGFRGVKSKVESKLCKSKKI